MGGVTTMSIPKGLGRQLGRPIRTALRVAGRGLYHMGLSHWVVGLSPHRIRTLLYHSVENNPSSYTAGLKVNVTPATFAVHMDYVRTHYSVSSIEQTLDGLSGSCPALITFDDGYASVERNAVPILEQRNLPATIFLIGSAVNGGGVWVNQLNHAINQHPDALNAILNEFPTLAGLAHTKLVYQVQTSFVPADIERLLNRLSEEIAASGVTTTLEEPLFSSADGILAMQKRGMYFGFHTQNHFNLQLCDEAALTKQLDSSSVAPLLNSNTFAYPFGYYSTDAIRKLTQQGYEQLMTVGSGTRFCCALHTGRSEAFGTTEADIFAQLEVEEPVMTILRKIIRNTKQFIQGSGLDGSTGALPLKSDIPETSKPR